jgi:hypothetical protein
MYWIFDMNNLILNFQPSGSGVNNDILQQALTDSGLTADPDKATNASEVKPTLPAPSKALQLSASGIATLSIHDAATGQMKRHVIRKVTSYSPFF